MPWAPDEEVLRLSKELCYQMRSRSLRTAGFSTCSCLCWDTGAELLLAAGLLSFHLGTCPAIHHSLDLAHGKPNVIWGLPLWWRYQTDTWHLIQNEGKVGLKIELGSALSALSLCWGFCLGSWSCGSAIWCNCKKIDVGQLRTSGELEASAEIFFSPQDLITWGIMEWGLLHFVVQLTDNAGDVRLALFSAVKPRKRYVLCELINLERRQFNYLTKDSFPPTSQLAD